MSTQEICENLRHFPASHNWYDCVCTSITDNMSSDDIFIKALECCKKYNCGISVTFIDQYLNSLR